jgi:hypothetical protein
MNAPSKIWIAVAGKESPDWIVERMTNAEVAADGSFDLEASDGVVRVEAGFAVFEFGDQVFACPPKLVQEKLATAAGADNEVVVELAAKTEHLRDGQLSSKAPTRTAPRAKLAGDVQIKVKPMIGEPPSPQFAGVDRLRVDDSYQRSIEGGASQKLIVKIAENWDWRLCLPLLVSRRNGELYVIDGQHRLEAARIRGDIAHMPVVVFDFDDPKAEAELFIAANRARRPMQALDDFHAAVVAGDAKVARIANAVTAAGLTVARNQAWQMLQPGEVVFTRAVDRALKSHGEEIAGAALGLLKEAFDGQVLIGGGAIFDALCTVITERAKTDKPVDLSLMSIVLSETGLSGWKAATAGVDSGFDRMEAMRSAVRTAYAEAEGE